MSVLTELSDGQPYLDVAVWPDERHDFTVVYEALLANAVRRAFGERELEPVVLGYERRFFRWMKPGPDGKLVPR